MGLADARRAVEQEAALDVLARRAELVLVPGDADHLAADGVDEAGIEDELVAGHRRPVVELQQRGCAAEEVDAEREHLTTEDVVGPGADADLCGHPRRDVP